MMARSGRATSSTVSALVEEVVEAARAAGPVALMEICGTHTVALFRTGVRSLLPESVRLVSGPGCPVCVTSQGYIDTACELASRPDVTIATYGDMVRVPGRKGSLERLRAAGADVAIVYSARDAVRLAAQRPERNVVFLAVGFETTTPGTASAVLEATARGLANFFILPGHKLVIPAMDWLLSGGEAKIDGFLCPGHVSVVIGADAYEPIASKYHKPCVVAGFEPAGMLKGLAALLRQAARGEARVENAYGVAVTRGGNAAAQKLMADVFEPALAVWRAIGTIAGSGLELRPAYRAMDARERFGVAFGEDYEHGRCRCGQVIQGLLEPPECPLFAGACTPETPIGPCMVSTEGTCAAWYKYHRRH
jgi:hydrogenase expression/formation protein HypD